MNTIHLLAVGEVAPAMLQELRRDLAEQISAACVVLPERVDPAFALHPSRSQYNSSTILSRLAAFAPGNPEHSGWRLVGVTPVDLYVPVLTFVFGEAQVGGPCAIVSTHRLRQEFYGLPPDAGLLRQRLLKEAAHELGHTFDLLHCDDYSCAMAASHSVEWIDLKSPRFCADCTRRLNLASTETPRSKSM
jgi:archaemetzincin